jgi:hypothetical protein
MVIGRRGIHRYLGFDEDIVKVQQSLVIDSTLAIAPRGASLSLTMRAITPSPPA